MQKYEHITTIGQDLLSLSIFLFRAYIAVETGKSGFSL